MNTIIFYGAGFLLALVVLAKIPGLEHLVRPLIDIVFSLVKFFAEHVSSWTIWLAKSLLNSHVELVRNLLLPSHVIDPTQEVRDKAQ